MKKCYDFGVWYVLVGLDEFKLSYWSFLNEFGYKKGCVFRENKGTNRKTL